MIGYMYRQQAYKLFNIEGQNIISSQCVIFDETGTISGTESAPWNDPTVEGQWEGLILEHLCQPEDNHTDEEDHSWPNHRPVGVKDIPINIPEWLASPGIQELTDQLEQLHLDVQWLTKLSQCFALFDCSLNNSGGQTYINKVLVCQWKHLLRAKR